jgi:hypothetical protein
VTAPAGPPPLRQREGEPPREVLYAAYVIMFLVLVAVLVIVGVYA